MLPITARQGRSSANAFLAAIFLCYVQSNPDAEENPIVSTVYGNVKGKFLSASNGVKAAAFLGIPYAAPPIGQRRFTIPEPPETWSDVRDCTEHPPRCIQMTEKVDIFSAPPIGDSEDCLTLNVFTATPNLSQSHAVMVYIHGGSFTTGSSYEYGETGIVENLVSKEVVVVVIQYRLGLFGFLSSSSPSAAGNWALWDQVEALKWVQDNIAEFGGDPQRVTIFGESAGAASVSLLSYIPLAQTLFHQTIEMSGSGYTLGVLSDLSAKSTLYLADALECPKAPEDAMIACIKEVPLNRLLSTDRSLFEYGYRDPASTTPVMGWTPIIDGYLIPDSMKNLQMTLQPKPTIIGTTNLETAYMMAPPPQMKLKRQISPTVLSDTFSLKQFTRKIDGIFSEQFYPNSAQTLRRLCKFQYLDSIGDSSNRTFLIQQYLKMMGDLWFHVSASKEARDKAEIGSKVWMYSFDYYNKNMFPEEYIWRGAHHASDLYFLFNIDFEVFKFERTEEDKKISHAMSSLWTNFAKFGDPRVKDAMNLRDSMEWPTFISFENSPTLHIGNPVELRKSFHQSSSVFWNKLVPEVEEIAKTQQEVDHLKTETFRRSGARKHEEL